MKRRYICRHGKNCMVVIGFVMLIAGLLLFPLNIIRANESGGKEAGEKYDIILENGRIIDGTGNPWYYGDVGITGDRITRIGCLKNDQAARRINAENMFVSPGFIDIHTHSDNIILRVPTADNSVRQGLTTVVGGNCGGSPLPVAEFLDKVEASGPAVNYILLAGHSSIRRQVMGTENRAPDSRELAMMKDLVDGSMKAGAFGLSTGLYYTPGFFAETGEIVELSRVVASHGGLYVSHIRDESDYNIGLLASINEAIEIGRQAGIRVQISHIKCLGKPVWHKSDEVLDIIEQARSSGVNVMFDQYPYTASSTGLWGAIFPAWAQEGGTQRFLERLEDPSDNRRIRSDMLKNIERRGGPNTLYVIREDALLSELAEKWKLDPVDAAIQIQRNGGSSVISFNMTDHDLENFMKSPYGMIGSDGSISWPGSMGHPRSFGAFPRVLGLYVREKNVLSWEEAVRKMTSAPANQLGIRDRGIIRSGMYADIVIFDPETVIDRATYENPSQNPEGIPWVLVNGKIVIDESSHTGVSAGKVLRHNELR